MSRRRMMLTGGAPVVTPGPLPGDGGDPGTPDPLWPGWPLTADATLLALRPHGRRVAHATTSTDANAAATAAKNQAAGVGGNGSLYWDGEGPDYRYDVIINPGTYDASMGAGGWGAYVGATGNPADVVIQGDDNGGGVIHSFGSQYLEALTLRAYTSDGDDSPKYPWHITGGQQLTAARCIFDASTAQPANAEGATSGLVGKDGQAGMATTFYDCTFIGRDGIRGFNMHGNVTLGDRPEVIAFINCTTIGVESVGGTGNRDLNGNPTRLYVIGLTGDEHLTSIGADSNTEVYTDSDLPVTGDPVAVHRGITTWPAPVDGLSNGWGDFYYPSALGDEPTEHTIAVTDAAPMQPVVGRTYITRVRLGEAARITHSGVTITTAAGQFASRHKPADSPYVTDEPPEVDLVAPDTAVALGKQAWKHYYFYTRYPGDNGFWTRCAFSSSSIRVTGSSQLAGITDCYYTDDGTTLVPVSSGTPHPLPFIRAT